MLLNIAAGVLPKYLSERRTQLDLGVVTADQPTMTWTQWDGDDPQYNITAADVQVRAA